MTTSDAASTRRLVYTLVAVTAAAIALGRVMAIEKVLPPSWYRSAIPSSDPSAPPPKGKVWPKDRPPPLPLLSSNDTSRWATIRALVDEGTYVIGHRDPALVTEENKYGDTGIIFESGWESVDKVMNPTTQEFYSSKPPLIPTLLAGEYWVLKQTLGWSFEKSPGKVVRAILITVNVIPLFLYLWVLGLLAERLGVTDWSRFYMIIAAGFATMVSPFMMTLNNHTLGTFAVLFAIYAAVRIWESERPNVGWFLLAGVCAGFAVTCELPALAFAGLLGLLLLWRWPGPALLAFAPATLLPIGVLVFTNYLALGEVLPAYAKFGSEWYRYPGSHWLEDVGKVKGGIDFAKFKETKADYTFHLLLGHHGLFSLTPVMFMSLAGMLWGTASLRRREPGQAPAGRASLWQLLASSTLLLTLVVVGFYIFQSDNYGGSTCGPRWLMWLTPLWLLVMIPVLDRMTSPFWKTVAYACLFLSVFSMTYPMYNPWRHPWLYLYMEDHGWISY
jgi:hypothetical protein